MILEVRFWHFLTNYSSLYSLNTIISFEYGALSIFLFFFQILPGLQSFCVAAAVAIGSIYLLQSSWFVAWLR